jgi:SagB-type dehydrogenase family enzyme
MKTIFLKFPIALIVIAFLSTSALAQELKSINLPAPQTDGGKPLMYALKERKSSRTFSSKPLSQQMISNLLWAAYGINRPDSGNRTAPSARNWQEIDIYLANAEGLYLYDAKSHALSPVLSKDIRAVTGVQNFVESAPINLVYVADLSKIGSASSEDKTFYSAADTGFISQNVYLFCASEGLSTVVRASIDRHKLAGIMKLKSNQKIILAQTIGYPNK